MEMQPKLKRVVRVDQATSVGILANKRAAQQATVARTTTVDGQAGLAIGDKFNQTVRKPYGSRGMF